MSRVLSYFRRHPEWPYSKLFGVIAAISLWRVARTSSVGIGLGDFPTVFPKFSLGNQLMYLYSTLLMVCVVRPSKWVHAVGAGMAMGVIGGRVWVFILLTLDGRPDLEGSVWERVMILMSLVLWHMYQSAMLGQREGRSSGRITTTSR